MQHERRRDDDRRRRPAKRPESDDALFQRFLSGDAGAFQTLFFRHRDELIALARYLCGDFETAEELVRRAMVRVFSRGDRGRHAIALRFKRAVVREARRFDRRARLWRAFGREPKLRARRMLPVRPLASDRDKRESARRQATIAALRRLKIREREIVALCDLCSLTYEEAAAVVGTTPRAVGVRLGRGRARFAKLFQRYHR